MDRRGGDEEGVGRLAHEGCEDRLDFEAGSRSLASAVGACPKANEEAPGDAPGACRIFLLMCDQYRAAPAPAPNRKLRPTLKTFLVSLTLNRHRSRASNEACNQSAHDVMRAVAKVVIVVLDEAGDPVAEGVFTAYAERPTVARIAAT